MEVALPAAVLAQQTGTVGDLRIVCRQHPALSGGHVLGGIEGVTGSPP